MSQQVLACSWHPEFIFTKGEQPNLLQADSERFFAWCESVQLSIELEKNAVLRLGLVHNPHSQFAVSNHFISSASKIKDLS